MDKKSGKRKDKKLGCFFRITSDDAVKFIRHQAWLNTKPEKSKFTRRHMYRNSYLVNFEPEIYSIWLVDLASECGLFLSSGYGEIPITWGEINSFFSAIKYDSVWVARQIKIISNAYVSELYLAKDMSRQSPYRDDVDIVSNRLLVNQQVKNFIKSKKSR